MVEQHGYTEKSMMPGIALALVFLVLIGVLNVAPQSVSSVAKSPLWGRDLVIGLDRRGGRERLEDSSRAGVTFLSSQQLLVYAVYRTSGQLSSRESPESSSPFRLHVWSVDSSSGQVRAEREWGTRVHDSAVQATAGGVLVRTGGIVKLYSPDLRDARELPFHLDANARVSTHVSPTGKTIVIDQALRAPNEKRWSNPSYNDLEVLDAASLATRYSWIVSPQLYGRYSISDVGIVASTNVNGAVIRSSHFGSSEWNVIFDDPSRTCVGDEPTAVTQEAVAIHCKELTVITDFGDSFSLPIDFDALDGTAPETCAAYTGSDKTTVASGAQVIALSSHVERVKKHLLTEATVCLTAVRIAVFDLAHKKQIFALNIDPLPTNDYDFALSPDGSSLAVLNDRRVSVYSVHP